MPSCISKSSFIALSAFLISLVTTVWCSLVSSYMKADIEPTILMHRTMATNRNMKADPMATA